MAVYGKYAYDKPSGEWHAVIYEDVGHNDTIIYDVAIEATEESIKAWIRKWLELNRHNPTQPTKVPDMYDRANSSRLSEPN